VAASVLTSGKLSTVLIDTVDGLDALEPEWKSVWAADPSATPFQSPEWLIPWTRTLWGGGRLCVLALKEDDRLVALAPFFLWGYGQRPLTLSLLGAGISDYLDMIALPEAAHAAAEAVLDWIDAFPEWELCDFQDLRPGSRLLLGDRTEFTVCPVLTLADSMTTQLAAADPHLRRSIRQAEKRLQSAGRVEFIRGDAQDCDALLDRLFELHTGRWQQRGEAGMFSTSKLREFHRSAAARLAAAGMLRLFGLAVEGEVIAVQYNFAAKDRVYAYQAGFDPAWGKLSPGSVLLAHSIEDAIADGAREFEFLRQREDFKYAWGAVETHIYRVIRHARR
jgi:CelD/BcsL family acetyltransferase involved in cellulose biosynthesis